MSTPQPVQANAPQIVEIGEVAAANIVKRLNLSPGKTEDEAKLIVATVKNAIRDEINAMSSHFTLAVHDVQTQYEAETVRLRAEYEKAVAEITGAFSYVKANRGKVAAVLSAVAVVAGFVGHFL